MKTKDLFKMLCFAPDIQKEYRDNILNRNLSIQSFYTIDRVDLKKFPTATKKQLEDLISFLEVNNIVLTHQLFVPSTICISCKRQMGLNDFEISISYWKNYWQPIHAHCKKDFEAFEKFECQCIDADCNDCLYFKRSFQHEGICDLDQKAVKSSSNFASSHSCFIHRASRV